MATYAIHSFGCRASAADGDALAAALEREGAIPSTTRAEADIVVVNTCAVTAEAERSARALIRRVRRENPAARIVATGCYAQRAPEELRALAGVHAVVGNSHKGSLAHIALDDQDRSNTAGPALIPGFIPLDRLTSSLAPQLHTPFPTRWIAGEHAGDYPGEYPNTNELLPTTIAAQRTRPILKVQDGCGNRCSFCVIPETRGPSRSVSLPDALEASRSFAARGGQELVLSGINLGRWGRDLRPARTLPELVRALLEETPLPRLRLSSIEPMDWGSELLSLLVSYGRGTHMRLAPHAHLPLQSGADAVLRRMHRRYRPWHYAEKVHALRAALPDAAIGADVMVGFPGETDALFQESYDLVASLPLTYLHLFPFSMRPRTAAEAMHREAPVDARVARTRMQALAELGSARQKAFAERFIGKSVSAVTLRDGTALSASYVPIHLLQPVPANRLISAHIASIEVGDRADHSGAVRLVGSATAPGPYLPAEPGLATR